MKNLNQLLLLSIATFLLFFACKKDDDNTLTSAECTNSDTELAVIQELNDQYAYPFLNANPDELDESLTPLIDYLGEANFVGMGEATHGTAEFYKMKDKLFRLLVTEKGFKAIVFEIPWGNCLKVNDFVTKGTGTAEEVIDQTYYWVYDTEEVVALAQWVHHYNEGLSDEEKIYFVGNDPQGGDFKIEIALLTDYITKVQVDSLDHIIGNYSQLPTGNLFEYGNASQTIKEQNKTATKKVYDYLLENRELFVEATTEFEFEIALMAAHVIQHREYIYRISNSGEPRDSLMAIYSEWWQRILGNDSKVALWAHNSHVMDGASFNVDFMGTFLRQRHADDYKNVGFSFGKGTANAFVATANYEFLSPVQIQAISEVPCNTLNQVLSTVDGDQHYIIFAELAGSTQSYFNQSQPFLQFGAGFNPTYINNYIQERWLSRSFDVLIHFDETKASVLQ